MARLERRKQHAKASSCPRWLQLWALAVGACQDRNNIAAFKEACELIYAGARLRIAGLRRRFDNARKKRAHCNLRGAMFKIAKHVYSLTVPEPNCKHLGSRFGFKNMSFHCPLCEPSLQSSH